MTEEPKNRRSGLLLHITSLPGPGGVGDLGPCAHHMAEELARAGQQAWQVLPLGPTGYGESPYQLFSSFAGNPLLVSLERLAEQGLLRPEDLAGAPPSRERADYAAAQAYRMPRLQEAAARLHALPGPEGERLRDEFRRFCHEQREWLEDYVLFTALKEAHGGAAWYAWEPALRDRHPDALWHAGERLAPRLDFHRFVQWQFFAQWHALRHHANSRGVLFIGDMPIFVAHDSVEVWREPQDFLLHPDGSLRVQAGVPPDYFSKTGQLWGNPLYNWERMAQHGFSFWKRRVRQALALYDRVRIDHFRGFCAHWEVPGQADTAVGGRWVPAPGHALFSALQDDLHGRLDMIAEDLGVITPDVDELRLRFGLPGMRVLQFAFGTGDEAQVRPFGYGRNLVVYTSTHDNDTFVGWFHSGGEAHGPRDRQAQRNFLEYAGLTEEQVARGMAPVSIHWAAIRMALGTVADLAILPVQDLLGLGSEARMNRPGHPEGNWGFRLLPGQLHAEHLATLRELTRIYGRLPGAGPGQPAAL